MSYGTVRKRLNELTEMGALEAKGHTRGRRYRFANPLRDAEEYAQRIRMSRGDI